MTNNKKNIPITQRKGFRLIILIVSFLLSIIVTIVSSITFKNQTDDVSDQVIILNLDAINIGISLILGCSTFIIIELIVLVVNAIASSDIKLRQDIFLENFNEYSNMLQEINANFYEVSLESHGDKDLFVTYAKKEIEKLNNTLHLAARQKQFSISSDYILNASGVFDAFSLSSSKILRITFPIMSIDSAIFMSSADSHFFEVLQKEVAKGIPEKVKVIVILEKRELEEKDFIKTLFDFFAAEKNYECKICLIDTFCSVCDTNGVSSQFVDFGIYGDKMLYIAEQYEPVHKGTYYKDEAKIKLYIKLFDEIWNSDVLSKFNESTNTKEIKMADLVSE